VERRTNGVAGVGCPSSALARIAEQRRVGDRVAAEAEQVLETQLVAELRAAAARARLRGRSRCAAPTSRTGPAPCGRRRRRSGPRPGAGGRRGRSPSRRTGGLPRSGPTRSSRRGAPTSARSCRASRRATGRSRRALEGLELGSPTAAAARAFSIVDPHRAVRSAAKGHQVLLRRFKDVRGPRGRTVRTRAVGGRGRMRSTASQVVEGGGDRDAEVVLAFGADPAERLAVHRGDWYRKSRRAGRGSRDWSARAAAPAARLQGGERRSARTTPAMLGNT
jgi:hypothetical protein